MTGSAGRAGQSRTGQSRTGQKRTGQPGAGPPTGQPPPAGPPHTGRPHFTGRAAILAVVLCAIALSLAYPVREYIAERRQIDQLQAQGQQIAAQLKRLQSQQRQLTSPAYIEEQARDRLHMCLPTEMCYEIIGPKAAGTVAARRTAMPWYSRLWSSVEQADKQPDKRPGPAPKR